MVFVLSYGNSDDFIGYYSGDYVTFADQMGLYFLDYYKVANIFDPMAGQSFTLRPYLENDATQLMYTDDNDYWKVQLNGGNDFFAWLSIPTLIQHGNGFINFWPRLMINGGAGDDTIGGGNSDDTLSGGSGNNVYLESNGNDTYIITSQYDRIVTPDPSGHDYWGALSGGMDTAISSVDYALPSFIENLILSGTLDTNGNGNQFANILTGNSGNNILDGGFGIDTLIGGAGDDVYVIDSNSDQVIELSGEGTDIIETSVSFTLPDFVEQGFLNSAGRNQSLTGNTLGNLLVGNSGQNTLSGVDGKDELRGEGGADSLYGGTGIDTLDGGTGADHMEGGAGNDIYYVDNGLDVVVELADGGYDTVFTSTAIAMPDYVEKLVFNGLTDGTMLSGNDLKNFLVGNYTDDIIDVGAGSDSVQAGSGDDTILGGAGADTLLGEFGIDSIEGGLGRDVLFGGAGADLFVFVAVTDSASTNRDLIKDFEDGLDRIDLRQIDAAAAPGDQAFAFIGTDAFTAPGQVRLAQTALVMRIEVNIDADIDPEMVILLNGTHDLTAAGFIL